VEPTLNVLTREIMLQRIRARHAEEQVEEFDRLLTTLGATIWHTDRRLRILGDYGRRAEEVRLDGELETFCRNAYGIDDPDAEAIAAHLDARRGRSVTASYEDGERRLAILVEPKRGRGRTITGTVGMAIELTARPSPC
jgi:hypothetical protein